MKILVATLIITASANISATEYLPDISSRPLIERLNYVTSMKFLLKNQDVVKFFRECNELYECRFLRIAYSMFPEELTSIIPEKDYP